MRLLPQRLTVWLRPLLGFLYLGLAILVLVPSPAGALWLVAIALEGFGPWFAVLGLTTLWPGWRATWSGRIAAICGVTASVLVLTPVFRARDSVQTVPAQLRRTFGEPSLTEPLRVTPFSMLDMVFGIWPDPVHVDTLVYREVDQRQLKLDLYRPSRPGPVPTVVTIHGGAWHHGNRHQLSKHNHLLARMGYAVAAIDYRLASRWQFPAALEDIKAALEFLRREGNRHGLDPDRVVLLGRSAGGHLALLAAYRLGAPWIRGVVAFYPPVDLAWGYENPTNPLVLDSVATLEGFLGGSLQSVPNHYEAASPHLFVSSRTPPTLLFHGLLDEFVSPRHSRVLVERLDAAGVPNLLVTIPWGHHAFDAIAGSPGGQLALYASERFLASVTEVKPQAHEESQKPAPGEARGQRAPSVLPWSSRKTEH